MIGWWAWLSMCGATVRLRLKCSPTVGGGLGVVRRFWGFAKEIDITPDANLYELLSCNKVTWACNIMFTGSRVSSG